ncbi:MAG: hypothetical protein PHP65_00585, partial [Bacilli bacterium]|nr:hypothetical protein [Bacilli bacterium]
MILLFITLIAILFLFIINAFSKNIISQLLGMFTIIGIIAYSGLGINNRSVDDNYVFSLFFFLLFFTIPFLMINSIKIREGTSLLEHKKLLNLNLEKISKIGFVIYLLTFIVFLVYPEFRLFNNLNIFNFLISGILDRVNTINQTPLLYWVQLITTLLYPFFWIHLFYLYRKDKKKLVYILIFFELYLKAMKFEYIGRTDLMLSGIMILLISITKGSYRKLRLKNFALLGILGLLSIPFFLSYIYTRTGSTFEFTSIISTIEEFISSEFYYPNYYEYINQTDFGVKATDYMVWFFSLPIPKAFIPNYSFLEI